MRSRWIWALLVMIGFVGSAAAQTEDVVAKKADEYLNAWAKPGRFSGVVLLAKGDKVVFRKAYGKANYELAVPNTPDMVFRIGSITKTFTAVAVLQLEQKGLLSVNDPVAKYVPEMPKAWSAITIQQVLTHMSGIPDFTTDPAYANYDDPQRVETALKNWADKPLLSAPGQQFRYSNTGYILLGRVVEKVSGKSYEAYLEENIFRPAGMKDSGYDHLVPSRKPRASGYAFDGEEIVAAKLEDTRWGQSAGALSSTADDMLRFDRSLFAGKVLLDRAHFNEAVRPQVDFVAPPPFMYQAKYGYGMMIRDLGGITAIGHGGWVNGFVSQVWHFPAGDGVVIVLSNFTTANIDVIARDLGAILNGAPYELPRARKVVHPDAKVLARYVGTYKMGPLESKVTMKNGKLYAQGTGQPVPYALIATSDTEFFMNDMPADIRFMVEPDGKVSRFVLAMEGREMAVERAGE